VASLEIMKDQRTALILSRGKTDPPKRCTSAGNSLRGGFITPKSQKSFAIFDAKKHRRLTCGKPLRDGKERNIGVPSLSYPLKGDTFHSHQGSKARHSSESSRHEKLPESD